MATESYGFFNPFSFGGDEQQQEDRHHMLHRSASEEVQQILQSSEPPIIQMPSYLADVPALASGGGAEVLPSGISSMYSTWMANTNANAMSKGKQASTVHYDVSAYSSSLVPATAPTSVASPFEFEDCLAAPVPSPARGSLEGGPFASFEQFFTQSITPSRTLEAPAPAPAALMPMSVPGAVQQPQPQPLQLQQQLQQQHLQVVAAPQTQPQALPPSTELITSANLSTKLPPHLSAASAQGLSYYSATGFDALSVLARVFNRPYPRVHLGPVDLTCSFVVVDTRRHDHPIVYCSPSFNALTGYTLHETLGRNCRFLQVPPGHAMPGGALESGGARPDALSTSAAAHLKKNLAADKECQTVITNYRKDGTPFTNLVTVIPIPGGVSNQPHEEHDVVFHVGFQVDLTEQPKMILENLQHGSYTVDYPQQKPDNGLPSSRSVNAMHHHQHHGHHHGHGHGHHHHHAGANGRGERGGKMVVNLPPIVVSKEMKKLLADPTFLRSIPVTTTTNHPYPSSTTTSSTSSSSTTLTTTNGIQTVVDLDTKFFGNHPLNMLLLELGPDFVHVVSLKGAFLYVAPSVRTVLGYQPEDLVGASIADLAHPEDVVPLMRELKESSSGAASTSSVPSTSSLINGTSSTATATSATLSSFAGTATTNDHTMGGGVVPFHAHAPRTVDLMFRAKTKTGLHVWVESRGRLHVEPGKGRKAIILTGRAREMADLPWEVVARGGGLALPLSVVLDSSSSSSSSSLSSSSSSTTSEPRIVQVHQEFWGTMSGGMTIITVGSAIRDVLGLEPSSWAGHNLADMVVDPAELVASGLKQYIRELGRVGEGEYESLWAGARGIRMRMRRGAASGGIGGIGGGQQGEEGVVLVDVNVYRCKRDRRVRYATSVVGNIFPAHLVFQVRVVGAEVVPLVRPLSASVSSTTAVSPSTSTSSSSPLTASSSSTSSSSNNNNTPNSNSNSDKTAIPATPHPDPQTNVFQVLDVSRGSSWQYELQQLKFGNQRLREEIARLEGAMRAAKARAAAAVAAKAERAEREAMRLREQGSMGMGMVGGLGGLGALGFLPPSMVGGFLQQQQQQQQQGMGMRYHQQQGFGGYQQQQQLQQAGQRRYAGLPSRRSGSGIAGGFDQQQHGYNGATGYQQQQQHMAMQMQMQQPNLSINLSNPSSSNSSSFQQATAALPLRTSLGSNNSSHSHSSSTTDSQQMIYAPVSSRLVGPSPHVQRVQEEVASQQQQQAGQWHGMSVPTSMKRTWGETRS